MEELVGTLRGVTVLLAEDAARSRALMRAAALEYCGATVLTVDSAPAAKSVLAAIRPKVVITDLAMPAMASIFSGACVLRLKSKEFPPPWSP